MVWSARSVLGLDGDLWTFLTIGFHCYARTPNEIVKDDESKNMHISSTLQKVS